jgi:hypothetical protein
MEEDSTATMVDDLNVSQSGATPPMEAPVEPLATPAPAPEDVTSSTSANVESAPAATVPPSNLPASDDLSADPAASVAAPPAAKQINWIEGGSERVRGESQTHVFLWKPNIAVEAGHETSLKQIIKRAEGVRLSSYGTPLPTGYSQYGTTEELFTLIRKTIAEQALLPQEASSLLTYFVLSSWFPDALRLAPCLAITGSAEEGDRVLQTLRILCRNPLLMIGINVHSLQTIYWDPPPTLLFNEQNLTKQKATFLGCSTRRGYLQGEWSNYKDLYSSKAIYVGDEVPIGRKLLWSLHVNAASPTVARMAPPLSDSAVVELQGQLLGYRVCNLIKVENSTFDAPGLPTDIRPVANALGSCVVGSSKLQNELISLLAPQVEQQLADRSISLEGMTLEAVLSLSHQRKSALLAGEIATEVNLISRAHGERLEFKPENIGHTLKKLGLFTKRLGKDGRGLVVDQPTLVRVHELAQVHGVGLDLDEKNLHCLLCAENTRVM